MLFILGVLHALGQDGNPIPADELPKFLGDVPPDQITWRVVDGPDFVVYHGKASPPLAGSVGFYLGGWPQDLQPAQTTVRSRLGRHRAKWRRSISVDGSIHQEAIIRLGGALDMKAHVWAEAPSETELNKLLAVVGQLPTFSSGALPDRFKELDTLLGEEQRVRRLIWICWSALVVAGAWLVDLYCRRRQVYAAFRWLILAGVIATSIAVTIGGVTLSPVFVIDWFHKANMLLLLTSAAVVFVFVLLIATGLFVARVFRNSRS